MPSPREILLVATLLCAGCTQFPDLDARLSAEARAAPYPALVPLEQITARDQPSRITTEQDTVMAARIAALRLRAAGLRGSVLDGSSRARLQAGVEPL